MPLSFPAIRISASAGPRELDDLAVFFTALNGLYDYASTLRELDEWVGHGKPLDSDLIGQAFSRERSDGTPLVKNLSMQSPMLVELWSHAQWVGPTLGFMYWAIKNPAKLGGFYPNLKASWNSRSMYAEIAAMKRQAMLQSLKDGSLDVLALDENGNPIEIPADDHEP